MATLRSGPDDDGVRVSTEAQLHNPTAKFLLATTPSILLLMLGVAGLVSRFVGLGSESFWFDELIEVTVSDPRLDFSTVLSNASPRDANPPLYHILLWVWRGVAGDAEAAMRLPSAVFGVASVAAAIVLGRRRLLAETSNYFAAFLACSYAGILYSHEARPYALLIALSATIVLLFLSVQRRVLQKRRIHLEFAFLVVVCSAAALTHYFGMLFAGTILLTLAITAVLRTSSVQTIVGGFVVWLFIALGWVAHDWPSKTHLAWLPNSVDWYLLELVRWYYQAFGYTGISIVPLGLIAFVAGHTVFQRCRTQPSRIASSPMTLVAVAGLATVLLALVLSQFTPLIHRRYFLVLLPVAYLLVAVAISSLTGPLRPLRSWLAVVIAASMLWPAMQREGFAKTQWRESAHFVRTHDECRNAIIPVWSDMSEVGWTSDMTAEYAYYLGEGSKIRLVSLDSTAGRKAVRANNSCPVLAWVAHVWRTSTEAHSEGTLRKLGLARDEVRLVKFREAYVVTERDHPPDALLVD